MTTTLSLMARSSAGRATTMTPRSAAVCVGMALGSTLGDVLLAFGDYQAVGVFTFVLLATSTVCVWCAWTARTSTLAPATAS